MNFFNQKFYQLTNLKYISKNKIYIFLIFCFLHLFIHYYYAENNINKKNHLFKEKLKISMMNLKK